MKGASRPPGPPSGSGLRSRTLQRFFENQGLSVGPELDAFLNPLLSSLSSPEKMRGRPEAAKRIAEAVRGGQRIVVFGDYDCDGMTATAILSDAIEAVGGTVVPLLASRFEGGYGLSEGAVDRVQSAKPELVVTCDCGSSDHVSIAKLVEAGIDVIVIDHHLVPKEKLPVVAFLNPRQPGCDFEFKGMASCGLALSMAAALRTELRVDLDVRKWLDLVAIGSIADVVPLVDDNRILVRAGLRRLRQAPRPGLAALLSIVGLEGDAPLTAQDVAFRIAPRLNAPGRMQAPDVALRLLRETDPVRARELAEEVDGICQRRREDQGKIEIEAGQDAERRIAAGARGIVVGSEGWNHGIVGIVAGRLAEKHDLPAVVIGFEDGIGTGSVRGPSGFPLYDALTRCAPQLVRYGGHQAAAGVTVAEGELENFAEAFSRACSELSNFEAPVQPAPVELDPADDPAAVARDLLLLEPCGEGNPAPKVRLTATLRSASEVRGGHLKLLLTLPSGRVIGGFAPNRGDIARSLSGRLRVTGRLGFDRYRGGDAVELLVDEVVPAD